MKKIAICLMTACLSMTMLNAAVPKAATNETSRPSAPLTKTTESEEAKSLELRLYEIKAMDKSMMKSSEKKELRKEVKTINRRMHDISGGVYISAGALIVVLVLLLVLL
jgi:hypothetical protein